MIRELVPSKGQTLFEVVAGVAVIGLVIVGLVRGLTTSIRNTRFVKEKSLAENYAREVSEWMILQRDNSWSNLENHLGTYCLNSLSWSTLAWPASSGSCAVDDFIPGTIYQREAVLAEIGDQNEEVEITIIISWISPRGDEEFTMIKNLTRWK